MAKGMKVNRPKKSLYKNLQKLGRIKKQQKKKQRKVKEQPDSTDPLTTSDILKKRRTNPKANITLSGKKRRQLLKKLQREETRTNQMEFTFETPDEQPKKENKKKNTEKESMDVDD